MPSFNEFLLIIFVIALVFGTPRLPQIGDALGRMVRNFGRSMRGENEIDVTPVELREIEGGEEDQNPA